MQRLDEVDDRVVCVCAVGARPRRWPSSSMPKVVRQSISTAVCMPGRAADDHLRADEITGDVSAA